jgi:catechol 2,3-dioxygenase-like lactoylglutathione lyase family enzyme
MAKIKHIAIRTHDVERTAAFYREAFELAQVGVGQNGVYLTDGYLNIAVLKLRPGMEGESLKLGVDHVGFQVDDIDATHARIQRLGGRTLGDPPAALADKPAEAQSYYEMKCLVPDGQVIDISNAGWVGAR